MRLPGGWAELAIGSPGKCEVAAEQLLVAGPCVGAEVCESGRHLRNLVGIIRSSLPSEWDV